MSEQWYSAGLQFTCTQCGDCCTGPPGFVWVNKQEIQQIAELRGQDVAQIEAEFVRDVGVRRSLRERANGDCVFLDEKTRRCSVYAARPRQCRSWPFWPSNLRTKEDWENTCAVCPGSGTGQLVPLEHIEAQKALIRV